MVDRFFNLFYKDYLRWIFGEIDEELK